MRTMFDEEDRHTLLGRLRRLSPMHTPRWGKLTAAEVLPHLADQMRITLGDITCDRIPSPLRYSPLREVAVYWAPWPKGVKGPPRAFETRPAEWAADLAQVEALVTRFVQRGPDGAWPEHPIFGRMGGRTWGVFCYRHFHHHLVQFGG